MPLSLDQQKAVAKHLNTRGQAPKCPVCGASNLSVQPTVTSLPVHDDPSATKPVVNVECNYCGYVLHFTPRVMDLDLDDAAESAGEEG
jgi:C4-type Zn-finger protein